MATKPLNNRGFRFVENVFGTLGYLFSGVIALFILVLAFYYALTVFTYVPSTIVSTGIYQSQVSLADESFIGILFIAFVMIVTFSVLMATFLILVRAVRWFVRTYSASLHLLASLIFKKYSARQLVLVKSLVFAIEAGLLLVAYVLYPSVLLLSFLASGAMLLVAALLCIAVQAVVVLSTRRAPTDIL